jgi:uncharacterized coiled-coil protein SlyX
MQLARLAAVAPIAFCLAASAPQDQTAGDLRREIDQLRQQVTEQQADLDAARARIQELEQQLADRSRSGNAGASTATDTAPPAPTPVPADPNLGPGGLLSSLQADYLAAFPSDPPARMAGSNGALERHWSALRTWATKTEREGVRSLSWTGTIDPNSVRASNRTVTFTVIVTNGSREYRVPGAVSTGTFERVLRNGALIEGPVTVNAIIKPRLRINPDRPAPGAFDVPPMVGPYVEFGYVCDVKSVVPAAPPATTTAPAAP